MKLIGQIHTGGRQEFRWINSSRLTGWLCPAVQIGDPADKVIRRLRGGGRQTARCSPDPPGSADFPIPALCNRLCGEFNVQHRSLGNHGSHRSQPKVSFLV